MTDLNPNALANKRWWDEHGPERDHPPDIDEDEDIFRTSYLDAEDLDE